MCIKCKDKDNQADIHDSFGYKFKTVQCDVIKEMSSLAYQLEASSPPIK